MKKILIIHSKYRNIGGEDVAVANEERFLKSRYNVKILYFNNKGNSTISQAISFITNKNKASMKKVEKIIDEFNPDVAYVHNTWFRASPGIFEILEKRNIRVLIKLHNFRYDCTRNYFVSKHLKGKKICDGCGLEKNNYQLFNKYFTDSYLKSILIIWYGKKYFKILKNSNFKLLVLTKFHKEYLIDLGFRDASLFIFPNYLEQILESNFMNETRSIVYAGRVSKEKGVRELIENFLKAGLKNINLKIIGFGPELQNLKKEFSSDNIKFFGQVENTEVLEIIKDSIAVVTSTKLLEGQPMLLCEASTLGIPSIFPKTGGISEFFPENYSLSFEQGNYYDLEEKFKLLNNNHLVKKLGSENKEFIDNYLNKEKLLTKFERIINE
jgi:glycosyltransferase involved in cell wall biosynthesis